MYRVVRADEAGHFRLENLVPGDYRVLALEEVEAWLNPDFARLHPEVLLHVNEGLNSEVNVMLSRKTR